MRFKLVLLMLLIILFTIFVVQNTEAVSLKVFFWHIAELPKIILLVVTLVIGIVLGFIISAMFNKKKITPEKLKTLNSTTNEEKKSRV